MHRSTSNSTSTHTSRALAVRVAIVLLVSLCITACADDGATSPVEPSADANAIDADAEPVEPSAPKVSTPARAPHPAPTPRANATIARVVDGDTVKLTSGVSVRLVQIDTPEVYGSAECGGRAASNALKRELTPGTRVRLVRDTVSDDTDRYGRQLRYVYKGDRNLNLWLVARGYAAPYFYDGERGRFAARLERSAQAARTRGLGLWGSCPNAVLDAYRGVATGPVRSTGTGGVDDARAGASASSLPAAPPYPPDVDCKDLPGPVRVTPDDPHHLDRDGDGIGCDG
ncbi:MAG: thermonuclease family protein [Thermoleophilia bacterium]|nr:thermonuclease family protein [Thermoleophilia bacterium]